MAGSSVMVRNEGGYVARFSVDFGTNGTRQERQSGDFTAGVNKSVDLPDGAKDIHVKAEAMTGLIWNPWSTIFEQIYSELSGVKRFTVRGTTLNPSYQEEAGAAPSGGAPKA